MIQVDLKVFKELSKPGSGLCVSEGNEDWEVMESDSRQIAGARSSPSGETGEDRSPPLMFGRGRRRAQLCVWGGSGGEGGCRERDYQRMSVQYEPTHAILSAYWDNVCVSDSFGLCVSVCAVAVCVCQRRPRSSGSAVAKQLTLLSDRLTDFHKLIWLSGRRHETLMKLFTSCQWKIHCSYHGDDSDDDDELTPKNLTHEHTHTHEDSCLQDQ